MQRRPPLPAADPLQKDKGGRMQFYMSSLPYFISPFVKRPQLDWSAKHQGWALGITPAVMKRCHWLEPVSVAQFKITEWTGDSQLRQAGFVGCGARQE